MSPLTQYIINQGVPQETIVFLLLLPVAATIVAFARQVIGIKGFGIYTPLILAFAFWSIGLKYGLAFFVTIFLAGSLARLALKKIRMLYLPRMAIILTFTTLAILALLLIAPLLGQSGPPYSSIFAILIMITLVEKFVAAQIERGPKGAVLLTAETLFLSLVCYGAIVCPWAKNQALNFPLWTIVGALLINFILSKWTGLRLSEYFRFKTVIKEVELPEKK